jgi:hypothetical protein
MVLAVNPISAIELSSYPNSLAKSAIDLISRENIWKLVNGKFEQTSGFELRGSFETLSNDVIEANKRNAPTIEIESLVKNFKASSADIYKNQDLSNKIDSFLIHLSTGVELLVKAYALAIETDGVITTSKDYMNSFVIFNGTIACNAVNNPWLEKTFKDQGLLGLPFGAMDLGTMGNVLTKLANNTRSDQAQIKQLQIFRKDFRNKVSHILINVVHVDEISKQYLSLINSQIDLCKAAGIRL